MNKSGPLFFYFMEREISGVYIVYAYLHLLG